MSAVRIIFLIVAICVGIAAVANKLDIFKRKAVVPTTAAMPAAQVMPPLSAWTAAQRTEAETLARKLSEALSKSDSTGVEKLLNLDALLLRSMAGFELPGTSSNEVITGMKQGMRGQGGLLSDVMGANAKFLRLTDIHKQGAALIRILAGEGGVSLIYIIPDFRGSGARVLDIYTLATGAFVSESIRDVMIPMIGTANRSSRELDSLVKAMDSVNAAKQSGDNGRLLAALRALPASIRDRPAMRNVYLQCLMASPESEDYLKELERIQREEAGNPSTTFKLLDLHILRKDWKAAADAGLELSKVIGGDSYLDAMTGMCLAYDGRHEAAEKLFDSAEAGEPDLWEVVLFRIHLDCARKDYAAVVKTLKRLEEVGQQPALEGMAEAFPGVKPFLESPEYKSWQESQ